MAEITITLNGGQANNVRRSLAADAEGSAKAVASHLSSVIEGHFNSNSARHNRESVDFCMQSLEESLAVLRQLPWSAEEELELGLVDNPEEVRFELARKERKAVLARGAAKHKTAGSSSTGEWEYRRDEEHLLFKLKAGEDRMPQQAQNALDQFLGRDHNADATLEDLEVYPRETVARIDGVGPKAMAVIDWGMDEYGLAFADSMVAA